MIKTTTRLQSHSQSDSASGSASARGFALVIALGLMSFILLLILSLTAFVRVESQAANTHLVRLEARQNALLGMHIALGNLQRFAGPDQRITARADIDATVASAAEANPTTKGGNRQWTGVWDTTDNRFLGYLISGFEGEENTALAVDFVAAVDAQGRLNDPSQAVLVGANSTTVERGFLTAPRQSIDSGSGSGNHAWWVGDLGLRAQISSHIASETTVPETSQPVLFPMRAATAELLGLDIETQLDSVFSFPQLDLILREAGVAAPETVRKDFYFDLTSRSTGLLTDARQGGFKKSLNAAFEGQMERLRDHHGSNLIFPPQMASAIDLGGPDWRQLQDYYRLPEVLSGSGFDASIASRRMTDTQGAIFPVMLHFQSWIHGSVIEGAGGRFARRLHVFPLVAFWNPYDVTLRGQTFYLRWMRDPPRVRVQVRYTLSDGTSHLSPGGLIQIDNLNNGPYQLDIPDIPPGGIVVLTPDQSAAWNSNTPMTPGDRDTYYFRSGDFILNPAGNAFVDLTDAELEIILTGEDNSNFASLGLGTDRSQLLYNGGELNDFYFFLQWIPIWGHRNTSINNPAALTFTPARPYPTAEVPSPSTIWSAPDGNLEGPVFGFFATLRQPELAINPQPHRHIRWLANFNPRASRIGRSPQDYQTGGQRGFNTTPNYIGATSINTNLYHTAFRAFNVGLSTLRPPEQTVLFSIPRRKEHILSIGDLRHANLSHYGVGGIEQREAHRRMVLDSFRPAMPIGESLADPRLLSNQVFREDWPMARYPKGSPDPQALVPEAVHYDWSYLLNEALFDNYFLAGLTSNWLQDAWQDWTPGDSLPILPNARLKLAVDGRSQMFDRGQWRQELGDFDDAAQHLRIDGAFNINSTSVAAWIAQLSAFKEIDVATRHAGTVNSNGEDSLLVRTLFPLLNDFSTGTENEPQAYAGFRRLSATQITQLAEAIVSVVRKRGPFFSLADFINREPTSSTLEHQLKGPLQMAIDRSGINVSLESSVVVSQPSDFPDTWSAEGFSEYNRDALAGPLLHGIPGYLSQGDLVARLGSAWSARSDTFVIRAYGDTESADGTPSARAVCEAIVQRMPEPVDPANSNNRVFRVVNFRWLGEQEI